MVIDRFSDGVMVGTGSTVGLRLGLNLALSQVPAAIHRLARRVSRASTALVGLGSLFALLAPVSMPYACAGPIRLGLTTATR